MTKLGAISVLLSLFPLYMTWCSAAPVLSFDGSQSYANMGDNHFNGLTNLTQEVWIKASQRPNESGFGKLGTIAGQGIFGGSANGFGLLALQTFWWDFSLLEIDATCRKAA